MKTWKKAALILGITFLIFALVQVVIWITMSYKTFPIEAPPGGTFKIGEEVYTIPKLPHKRYGTNQVANYTRPVPVVPPETLKQLVDLTRDLFDVMRSTKVPFWATGGTAIGAVLWKSIMCYDDDVDISILFSDKNKLWTTDFIQKLAQKDMEIIVMRGVTRDYAPTREMSSLRVRRKNTDYPVIDIFFLDWDAVAQKWAHVDGWNKDQVWFDKKTEVWDKDWMFPLREVEMNGIKTPVPNKVEKCLDKHYGPEWKTVVKSPSPMFKSHRWVHKFTNFFPVWKVLTVKNPGYELKLVEPTSP